MKKLSKLISVPWAYEWPWLFSNILYILSWQSPYAEIAPLWLTQTTPYWQKKMNLTSPWWNRFGPICLFLSGSRSHGCCCCCCCAIQSGSQGKTRFSQAKPQVDKCWRSSDAQQHSVCTLSLSGWPLGICTEQRTGKIKYFIQAPVVSQYQIFSPFLHASKFCFCSMNIQLHSYTMAQNEESL